MPFDAAPAAGLGRFVAFLVNAVQCRGRELFQKGEFLVFHSQQIDVLFRAVVEHRIERATITVAVVAAAIVFQASTTMVAAAIVVEA